MKTVTRHTSVIEGVSRGLEYALLKPNGEQAHGTVCCKDYFQDVFWSRKMGKPGTVYGFAWAPDIEISSDPYMMVLRVNGRKLVDEADNLRRFLNEFEEKVGWTKTIVETTDNPEIVTVKFGEEWTTQPFRISMFTFFLRIGFSYPTDADWSGFLDAITSGNVKGLIRDGDVYYLNSCKKAVQGFWESGKVDVKQEYADYSISAAHSSAGVVNFLPKAVK